MDAAVIQAKQVSLGIAQRSKIKPFCFFCGCEGLELHASSCGETWKPISAPGKPFSQVSYSLDVRELPC